MRKQANDEQGGLCAYCMSLIPQSNKPLEPPDNTSMKIEHFEARNASRAKMFDWSNLLGVCIGDVGIEGGGESDQQARYHCDTYRGHLKVTEQGLDLNPAAFPPDIGERFSYTVSGEARTSQRFEPAERDKVERMIARLNLNLPRLRRNRAAVIGLLRRELQKKPTLARVKELLQDASAPGAKGLLRPYCQVAIHYLQKKLRQL
ncbi:Hypothetical protein CAP_3551 [Chondromyces apiculatus DSM 436]|uniref:TIGR02646 family protein n=2 Tax=Chondromyces apiculatus TaxID=51 RepID=A0A017T9A9_9BACT|nr:Hypothetical protein CAP_3551 [Chondromyces apiculatus DSM 436]